MPVSKPASPCHPHPRAQLQQLLVHWLRGSFGKTWQGSEKSDYYLYLPIGKVKGPHHSYKSSRLSFSITSINITQMKTHRLNIVLGGLSLVLTTLWTHEHILFWLFQPPAVTKHSTWWALGAYTTYTLLTMLTLLTLLKPLTLFTITLCMNTLFYYHRQVI